MEPSHIHLIPKARRAEVRAALVKTFQSAAIDQIEILSGGLSGSAVLKIVVEDQPYVLKMHSSSEHEHSSSEGLISASEAGIAPRVYYWDPSSGIIITRFIESQPIRKAFPPEKLVSELAKTIRCVHALDCQIQGQDLRQMLDGTVNNFLHTKALTGPVTEECLTYYATIRQKYPWDDADKVFSQNEINPSNLLCDGNRLWLVDWDVAFLNDRYVDLATAANFFVQTEEQELEFMRVYFNGVVDEYKRARFYIMRQISRIVYSLKLVEVAARSKPEGQCIDQKMEGYTMKAFGKLMATGKISMTTHEGQLMFAKAQMNEAIRNMRSPRFVDSLNKL